MKKKLAFGNGQFKCDTGNPPTRFYLGADAKEAQARKVRIVALWDHHEANGGTQWTPELLAQAKTIAKGSAPFVKMQAGELDEQYHQRAARMSAAVGPVTPAVTASDFYEATIQLQNERITELESLVREKLGAGAVVGPAVTIHAALDAFTAHRQATELDPDTHKPTDHVRSEANVVKFIKRHVEDLPLSRLNWMEINKWCKTIAARPTAKKTGRPITADSVKNCLKTIRRFVKWASHQYQWHKPEDWHEATKAMVRRTKEERRAQIGKLHNFYIPEEIGTLWKFARPLERLLILLGLNFGYTQAEIIRMEKQDIAAERVAALRHKTGVIGEWSVWPETRALAEHFSRIPKTRQGISNQWRNLYKRITKDHPQFKWLSFKWLRKTGASMIRKVASGEIATTYISHGEAPSTDDELLEVYAATDWDSVCAALDRMRDLIAPHLQADELPGKPHVARNTIDIIREGWEKGLKWMEICKLAGVSRDTVYRYRPVAE